MTNNTSNGSDLIQLHILLERTTPLSKAASGQRLLQKVRLGVQRGNEDSPAVSTQAVRASKQASKQSERGSHDSWMHTAEMHDELVRQ